MLKLPKGLKKKKKSKKSKKNQELFTEEELEAYKREQREKQLGESSTGTAQHQQSSTATESSSADAGGSSSAAASHSQHPPAAAAGSPNNDDEWSKFKALTTGIDTVLKKTQGDLDRIKESSFFQRVPTPREQQAVQAKKDDDHRQAEAVRAEAEHSKEVAAAAVAAADHLAQAVVELSESEEESDDADDIFNTAYIDTLTSGGVQLAYVPESPVDDVDDGPDPFDTSYADKVIKGPEVSKKGKKLVNIGSAVEVLTGRVERVTAAAAAGARRPRRGPQNLLLESFDDGCAVDSSSATDAIVVVQTPVKTLLDDFIDDIPNVPIDLSVSLHIAFQKEQDEQKSAAVAAAQQSVLSEFDALSRPNADDDDDDDEFAELAAESLTKKDEVQVLTSEVTRLELGVGEEKADSNWAAFGEQQSKGKKKLLKYIV